jgi:geranyl-CoA carboxylase alpha subunit
VGYRGAGTVEFIVDADLRHYFLEMNTRLQVEHPVTEMVTGLDLVEWQLRVAAGQPLPLAQAEVRLSGHAIEARLYAEDPYAGFAPQTGTVRRWRPQHALHAGVRIDAGIEEGSEVSPWYDPMVAKVIAHGRDRDDAIRRLRAALQNTPLLGLRNNGRFLADLVDHPAFRNAAMTTTLIDQWQEAGEPLLQRPVPGDDLWCLAAATFALQDGPGWRANSVAAYGIPLQCEDSNHTLRVQPDRTGLVRVELGTQRHEVRIFGFDDGALRYEMDGVRRQALACIHESELHLAVAGSVHVFREVSAFPNRDAAQDATRARAPVAGKVTQVQVAVGDAVALGQALVCVEAMKMEMWLSAQAAGRVTVVHAQAGDQVESGALLVEIELENNTET